MKHLLYIFLLLMCVTSCKKDSKPYAADFDTSLKNWTSFKASVNNSYTYTLVNTSVFNASIETKVTVTAGKVTARSYTFYIFNSMNQKVVATAWTEDASTINTHNIEASVTLDDIYTKAQNEWLTVDRKSNAIYFEVDAKGLIATCGYSPANCMDDCFHGVHITAITAL